MTEPRDWLLTRPERGNPSTRLDDRHDGDHAWSEGNLVTPLVHGAPYFRALYDALERDPRRATWCSSPTGRATRTSGSPASPAREVVEVLGSRRRARRRRPRPGVALPPRPDRLLRHREPAPRRAAPAPRRRGAAGHAGARRRLAPPEVRRHPPPRRPVARRRLRRRHRPRPQPARRRRPPGRPAAPAADRRVRPAPAVARRPGEDPGPGRPRRRDRLPRAVGGPDAAEPQPAAHASRTGCAGSTSRPDPLPAQQPPPPEAGTHTVQLLRTYPNLRHGRDFPFARGGERSVARGYTKAIGAGERPGLRRGPVLLGPRRRRPVPGRAARATRAAAGRGDPARPGRRRARPDAGAARAQPGVRAP